MQFLDRVGVSSATTGAGTLTLGAAVTNYQTMAAAGAVNGAIYRYLIVDGSAWEVGFGVYSSSGPTLTRILVESSTGSLLVCSGLEQVFLTFSAADINTLASGLGYVNKFCNASFDIAQLGTSGSVASGVVAYSLDGWIISPTGVSAAWSQIWNTNLAGNSLRIAAATGMTACNVAQRVESYFMAELMTAAAAAQPVTVQFTIYNGLSSTITPKIQGGYASARDNFGTITADLAATNLQSIGAGASATVAYTFTPNANMANGYQFLLAFGGALNAASGSIQISRADIRATPGLATGLNANPPPPELLSVDAATAQCQRFFDTTYDNGVAPGASTTSSGAGAMLTGIGLSGSTNSGDYFQASFHRPMRAAPSVTIYDRAGNSGKSSYMSSGAFTDNASGVATGQVSTKGFLWASNNNSGYVYYIHYAADARL